MLGSPAVARLQPFSAVRYDERVAGPLDTLVAPPYDVLSPEERARYAARSPYNVVHLTLPGDEGEAARLWTGWQEAGVLVRESEPALWWLAQDYAGPDGVARTREGLLGSLHVEPYSARVVLPHERTHAGPKEGRMRLLRALRAHVEPIFLLYDGTLAGPGGEPLVDVDLEGVRNRLWRVDSPPPSELAAAQLVIADGHHRYETALAFHEQEGTEETGWLMVVVVPTRQEGLTIFPTHRVAGRLSREIRGEAVAGVPEGLSALPADRAAAVLYRGGTATVVAGEPGELDAALVDRLGAEDVAYTPRLEEAIDATEHVANILEGIVIKNS